MDIAKFTMQINIKEDLANIMKKDAELYARINCQDKHTAMEKIAADDALKREILSHARLNEKEFNALREGQAQMLQNQEKMMRSLKISSSLKACLLYTSPSPRDS